MDSNNGNMVTEMVSTTVQEDTNEFDELSTTDLVRYFDFVRGQALHGKNIYFILAGGFNDYSKNDDFYYHYIY